MRSLRVVAFFVLGLLSSVAGATCSGGTAYTTTCTYGGEAHQWIDANYNQSYCTAQHNPVYGDFQFTTGSKHWNRYVKCGSAPSQYDQGVSAAGYTTETQCSTSDPPLKSQPTQVFGGNITAFSPGSVQPRCYKGCEYNIAGIDYVGRNGDGKYRYFSGYPTGKQCGGPDPQTGPDSADMCSSDGVGGTICDRPDHHHCVTTAQGYSACWANGESGSITNANRTAGATQSAPGSPLSAPQNRNGETFTSDGGAGQVSDNGSSSVSNIGGYTNTGTPNPTGQPISGDGSNGGLNNGSTGNPVSNPSSSSSSSSCDPSTSDCTGAGSASGTSGVLYSPNGDTVGAEFATFRAHVAASPLITAGAGYLTIPSGGSCPAMSVPSSPWWPDGLNADFLCTGPLADALVAAGYVLLALAAWCAFKIALY